MKTYIVVLEERNNPKKIYIDCRIHKLAAKFLKWIYHFKYDNVTIKTWYE